MAGKYVEELAAKLGWEVDTKTLDNFTKKIDGAASIMGKFAGLVSAASVAAGAYLVVARNNAITYNAQIAKAAGLTAEFLEVYSGMMSLGGVTSESIAKSAQYLNKQIGAIKSGAAAAQTMDRPLRALGLSLKEISALPIEQQFESILEAAQKTDDAQVAISAGQALLGRDAARMIGYLRAQGRPVADLVELQKSLNFQTDVGRKGAERFAGAWDLFTFAISTFKDLLSGLLGEQMAPTVEKLTEWVGANRELIQTKAAEWVDRLGRALKFLSVRFQWLFKMLKRVVDFFGGFENVLKLAAVALGSLYAMRAIMGLTRLVGVIKSLGVAAMFAQVKMALIPLAIAAVIALLFLLGEDLYHFFTGGESALGKLGDKIAEFFQMKITPFIAHLFGMTPEELDYAISRIWMRIEKFFTKDIPNAYDWLVNKIGAGLEKFVTWAGEVRDSITRIFSAIADYIGGAFLDRIRNAVASAGGLIRKIPGADWALGKLGGLAETARETMRGALPSVTPSPGATTAASQISNRSEVKNVATTANITVNAPPGADGRAIGREVRREVQREMGRAAKALASA